MMCLAVEINADNQLVVHKQFNEFRESAPKLLIGFFAPGEFLSVSRALMTPCPNLVPILA